MAFYKTLLNASGSIIDDDDNDDSENDDNDDDNDDNEDDDDDDDKKVNCKKVNKKCVCFFLICPPFTPLISNLELG